MTAPDGFRFAGIDPHIERLDGHAARMERVVEAARPLGMDAYGIIGRLFADAASSAADEAVGSVRRVEGVAAAYAEGLRRTRDTYLDAERVTRASVAGIDGGGS